MQNHKNYTRLLSAAMAFSLLVCGCAQQAASDDTASDSSRQSMQDDAAGDTEGQTAADSGTDSAIAASPLSHTADTALLCFDPDTIFTERDLETGDVQADTVITLTGDTASIDGAGASADGGIITITDEGIYRLTGTLDDGRVIVASEGKVQLLLDHAHITSSDGCAVWVQSAKKVFLTLAQDSENSVTDGSTYADTAEDAPDAAIYSKDSLTLNGTGSLTVNARCDKGIVSRDDLVITGGSITVDAVGDGIRGKDYVAVQGASVSIQAGGDGIRSSNTADEGMGFVYIRDGSFEIEAAQDGIQAESQLVITGGDFTVTSGGGTAQAVQKQNDFGGFGRGGWDTVTETDTETDTVSVKGIKAGSLLYITGGALALDTADDALHSNGDLLVEGGSFSIAAGDKALHADGALTVADGEVDITQSYEGLEGTDICVSGGMVRVCSGDDGFNASDGSDEGAMGRAVSCTLSISGGYVYVDAGGDGLDSNGSMDISGGTVLVNGPTNDGNGALDGNSSLTCSGGVLIAAGSSGMAEYPEGTQNTIILTLDSYLDGGTLVTVCDDSGKELLSFAPAKQFNSVILSTPDLISGNTYTLYTGGTSSAAPTDGLYPAGGYRQDGTEAGTVTLDDTVGFIGEAGGMGGMPQGGMGGFGRQNGNGGNFTPGEIPTDENGDPVTPDFGNFTPGEVPTDENGDPVTPDFGNFTPGEMPTDENGDPVMHGGGMHQGGPRGGRGMQEGDSAAAPEGVPQAS